MIVFRTIQSLIIGCLFTIPLSATAASLDEIAVMIESGKLSQAQKSLDIFLDDKPRNEQGLIVKSYLLIEKGQLSEAQSLLKSLPEPTLFPAVLNNLAIIEARQGHWQEARDLLLRAMRTSAQYHRIYENLSTVFATMASEAYQKALNKPATNLPQPPLKASSGLMSGGATPDKACCESSETPGHDRNALVDLARGAVQAWARDWSQQNVKAYLSHYADDFIPDDGGNRQEWEQARHARLRSPDYIKIQLTDLRVSLLNNKGIALAQFYQHYQSNSFDDTVRKTLILSWSKDRWEILHEQSLD